MIKISEMTTFAELSAILGESCLALTRVRFDTDGCYVTLSDADTHKPLYTGMGNNFVDALNDALDDFAVYGDNENHTEAAQ